MALHKFRIIIIIIIIIRWVGVRKIKHRAG